MNTLPNLTLNIFQWSHVFICSGIKRGIFIHLGWQHLELLWERPSGIRLTKRGQSILQPFQITTTGALSALNDNSLSSCSLDPQMWPRISAADPPTPWGKSLQSEILWGKPRVVLEGAVHILRWLTFRFWPLHLYELHLLLVFSLANETASNVPQEKAGNFSESPFRWSPVRGQMKLHSFYGRISTWEREREGISSLFPWDRACVLLSTNWSEQSRSYNWQHPQWPLPRVTGPFSTPQPLPPETLPSPPPPHSTLESSLLPCQSINQAAG